jgi:hypothetical protein
MINLRKYTEFEGNAEKKMIRCRLLYFHCVFAPLWQNILAEIKKGIGSHPMPFKVFC